MPVWSAVGGQSVLGRDHFDKGDRTVGCRQWRLQSAVWNSVDENLEPVIDRILEPREILEGRRRFHDETEAESWLALAKGGC